MTGLIYKDLILDSKKKSVHFFCTNVMMEAITSNLVKYPPKVQIPCIDKDQLVPLLLKNEM